MTVEGRRRMTAAERREQLIATARTAFAERGYDGTSVEDIASRANVSKPVVYEHFGGKEGLYAVVVDREVRQLLDQVRAALSDGGPRALLEQAALAFLDYIEQRPEGFRILVRDNPPGAATGSYRSIIGDIASRVEGILVDAFDEHGFDPATAPVHAQMLVGMVGAAGSWWLETRAPAKEVVATNLVNLAWNGLAGLETHPTLRRG